MLFIAGSRGSVELLWLVNKPDRVDAGPVKVVKDEANVSNAAVLLFPGAIELMGKGVALEAIAALLPIGVIMVTINETLVAELNAPEVVVPTAIELVSMMVLLARAIELVVELDSIGTPETKLLGVAM